MAISKQKLALIGSASIGACAYASFNSLRDGINWIANKILPEPEAKWVPSSLIAGATLVGGAGFLVVNKLATLFAVPQGLFGGIEDTNSTECIKKICGLVAREIGSTGNVEQFNYCLESQKIPIHVHKVVQGMPLVGETVGENGATHYAIEFSSTLLNHNN